MQDPHYLILLIRSACIWPPSTENSTEAAQVNLMQMGVRDIVQSLHKKQCWKALKGVAEKEAISKMNELQTYSNAEFGSIRSIVVDDIPYFVGRDVASILGYANTRDALAKRVDNEDKLTGVAICDTNGRETKPVLINESGLYSLILTSKLPSAKEFKRWVTASVLPMIRKTGVYSAGVDLKNGDTVTPMRLLSPDDYLSAARLIATCKSDRLNIVLALLSKGGWEIPQMAPAITARQDTSDIAERIKSVRTKTGVTLQEISDISGVSVEVLRSYETGRRFPKQERYANLIMALNRIEDTADKEGC